MNNKLIFIIVLVLAVAAIVSARRSSYSNQSEDTSGQELLTSQAEASPELNAGSFPSGLKVDDLVLGSGAVAVRGSTLTVNYLGVLIDGTKFDSSYDRGEPFQFVLGAGAVIAGWDIGLDGMKVGGKRRLTIPSDLAYGDRGAGNIIPPNATLVFEIELLGVK